LTLYCFLFRYNLYICLFVSYDRGRRNSSQSKHRKLRHRLYVLLAESKNSSRSQHISRAQSNSKLLLRSWCMIMAVFSVKYQLAQLSQERDWALSCLSARSTVTASCIQKIITSNRNINRADMLQLYFMLCVSNSVSLRFWCMLTVEVCDWNEGMYMKLASFETW
jgi:hypothetical protein